ncbi:hypothetical protein NQZ68_023821 [Dissostichus eleginoides]|nr:hypothetical protein NQZ68_023821 [Dissostichus eleginoides]
MANNLSAPKRFPAASVRSHSTSILMLHMSCPSPPSRSVHTFFCTLDTRSPPLLSPQHRRGAPTELLQESAALKHGLFLQALVSVQLHCHAVKLIISQGTQSKNGKRKRSLAD